MRAALGGEGDSAAEEELLWRALRQRPNLPRANLMLGNLLLHEHHDPEAMDRFETVLAINLRSAEARRGELAAVTELAERMRQLGHPELALKAYSDYKEYHKSGADTLFHIARCYEAMGDPNNAIKFCSRSGVSNRPCVTCCCSVSSKDYRWMKSQTSSSCHWEP